MNWINDVVLFLLAPGLVLIVALLTYRGPKQGYKIVKETNSLGESRYEVWFEYYSIQGSHGWLHEQTFDTQEAADQFIARQHKIREVVKEGKLNETCKIKY